MLFEAEDLETVYACAQSRREQGSRCAFAVVAVADYAAVQSAIADHNVEPIMYESGLCVFEFLDLSSAARLRDDLLATSASLVQLFWIDGDPRRGLGPSRGVQASSGLTEAGAATRRTRRFDDHRAEPCEHCS